MERERLGLSGITTQQWSLRQDVDSCVDRGLGAVGLWQFKMEDWSTTDVKDLLEDHGLEAPTLCFGGLFTGSTEEERRQAVEDTRRALQQAEESGAQCVLIVGGPIGELHPSEARKKVVKSLKELLPDAEETGVTLALEPFHPMYATEWCMIHTLDDALDILDEIGSRHLEIMVDTYHIWWDSNWSEGLERAGAERIASVQIADWRDPTRSFEDRTVPGRGVVPFRDIIGKLEEIGYTGFYELELFSEELWEDVSGYPDVLDETVEWFESL